MRAELVLKRARRAIQTFEHSRCTRGARGRKKVGWFRAELHHFSLSLPLLSTTSVHHVAASLFPRGGAFLFASKAPVSSDDVSLLPFPPPHPKQRRVALSLPRSLYRLPFSACVLFDHSLRQLALSFSFVPLDRNSSLGDDLPFREKRKENLNREIITTHFRVLLIDEQFGVVDEQINLSKPCFTLFFGNGLEKWECF